MKRLQFYLSLLLTAYCLLPALGQQSAGVQTDPPVAPPPVGKGIDLLAMLDTQLADLVEDTHLYVVSVEGVITVPMTVEGDGTPSDAATGSDSSAEPPEDGAKPVVHLSKTGSGFLTPGGTVVTTTEVVIGMQNVSVRLPDGRRFKVSRIRSAPHANVAILIVPDIDPALGLHWGSSRSVRAGNLALTIGTLDGFADSAALGIISSTERSARATENGQRYRHLIQFQGALGAGGSGSPLLNTHGEVIGMVVGAAAGAAQTNRAPHRTQNGGTAGAQPDAHPAPPGGAPRVMIFGGPNMGLALPSNIVRNEVEVLLKGGRALPPVGWIGVISHAEKDGVTIDSVVIGSPADRAGVLPDDLVTAVDGRPIRDPLDLGAARLDLVEGQEIMMDLRRGAQVLHLRLHILARPSSEDAIEKMPTRSRPPRVGASPRRSPLPSRNVSTSFSKHHSVVNTILVKRY